MAVIDSATRTSSINTVSQASGVQAQNAAAETDVSNTADRLAANRELLNTTPTDGNHTLKEMNIAQAQLDVKLSQTEFIVYDGELSSANIELQAIKAQITGKESGLATEQAKTEIKTSINANGEAEFITHSGMKVVTDVNKGGHTTKIYNPAGEQLMQIEGDPHVNMLKDADGNNGYDFHFGDDSTLKLEDGAEITFNTKQVSPGVYYTVGLDVAAGDNVMHTGMDTSDSEASRKSDIVKVEASTVHKRGDTTQGAVMMGLKGDGQILMQTGDNQWNEIKDETWDGYLANKSFDGQAGAKVDFKPQTIMTSGDLASIKLEITQLKGQQAKYESRVATLTPLKSMAENNLDTANSNLATYQSMDDSAFVDNGANRKETEQKSLELSKRANNLGSFMALSNLVSDANFKQLGVSQGDMVSGAINADREYGENNIRYIDQGLQHSADRNSGTSNLVNSLSHLAEVSDFEEKSVQSDSLVSANQSTLINLEDQMFKTLFLVHTDAGKAASEAIKAEIKVQRDLVKGDLPTSPNQQRYDQVMSNLNTQANLGVELRRQLAEVEATGIPAPGGTSAATLRTQIAQGDILVGFLTETAAFWKPAQAAH